MSNPVPIPFALLLVLTVLALFGVPFALAFAFAVRDLVRDRWIERRHRRFVDGGQRAEAAGGEASRCERPAAQ